MAFFPVPPCSPCLPVFLGAALLFAHDVLHEGAIVTKGSPKIVIKTELLFRRVSDPQRAHASTPPPHPLLAKAPSLFILSSITSGLGSG